MSSRRRDLFIILIVVYFLFFDTHFQMPILAPFARSLGATPFLVGLIVGMYSFFNILGNVISGHFIDSRSWKKPVTVGILMIMISLFSYALAPSPIVLLLIRAFHGFAGGLVVPATLVYLTKSSLKPGTDGLSKRMSFYGASIGPASFTGPPLAGILASIYGYERTYMVVAFLMGFAAILVIFFLKDNENKIPATRKITPREYYDNIMSSSLLRLAFRLVFALMGATGTLAAFLPFQAESLGASSAVTGGLFATFAATAIVAQLFWPKLVVWFKLFNNALAGLCLIILALTLIHYIESSFTLFFALAIYGLGFGLLFPALLELVARGSQAAWKGLATGIFFVFFSLGAALVPPLAGLLQQSQTVSPFFTAAAVSSLLILTLPKNQKRDIRNNFGTR
jgi:MFS transporter, DHA1 family, multidrug resistance protein